MTEQTVKKILVVEDYDSIRESMAELLESEGFEVSTAENGQAALDYLGRAAKLPNLILLDLMMPVKDGFQFRAEQILDAKISGIPVIVMSADGQLQQKLKDSGVSACVKKPLDIDNLIATIHQHCR